MLISDRTSVMSGQLYLNCWVFGKKADRVFPVKIAGTESVDTLKKAIKEENSIASTQWQSTSGR